MEKNIVIPKQAGHLKRTLKWANEKKKSCFLVQRGKKRKPSQLMTWKVFEKKSMCAKVKTNCQNET